MLQAVEQVLNGPNADQQDLAGRCARREFQDDPGLAMRCLFQMGAGGPMQVHITRFQKMACEKARGQPGYVCDFSFAQDVSGGRSMGYLGNMMRSGGNCTGRFIQAGSGWVLQEKNCS